MDVESFKELAALCRTEKKLFVDPSQINLELPETVKPQQISTKIVPEKILQKLEAEVEKREQSRMKRLTVLRNVLGRILGWRRPEHLFPGQVQPKFLHEPLLLRLKEGIFDDGWFWLAVSMIATRPQVFNTIFISFDYVDVGMVPFQFYHVAINDTEESGWRSVVIDNQIPFQANGIPAFGQTDSENEIWGVLLEKAYAKFLGTYSLLHCGDTWEAAVHLTGGRGQLFNWDVEQVSIPSTCVVWWLISEHHRLGLLTAVQFLDPFDSGPGHNVRRLPHFSDPQGTEDQIFYEWNQTGCVVLSCVEITQLGPNLGLQLVKLWDPYGHLDWNGDWGAESPLWTQEMRDMLGYKEHEPHVAWMKMDDLVRQYNLLLSLSAFNGAPTVFFEELGPSSDGSAVLQAAQFLITISGGTASTVPTSPPKRQSRVAFGGDEEPKQQTPSALHQDKDGNKCLLQIHLTQPKRDLLSTQAHEVEINLFKTITGKLHECIIVDTVDTDSFKDAESYVFEDEGRTSIVEESGDPFSRKFSASLQAGKYILTVHQQFAKEELRFCLQPTVNTSGFTITTVALGSHLKPYIQPKHPKAQPQGSLNHGTVPRSKLL